MASQSKLPLEGMVVLDCTHIMAGPFCTLLLADMGAEVIKIEKPDGGDDTRRTGPPFVNGWSAAFLAMNRNKRSISLDLRQKGGQEVFRRMVKKADVVAENFGPGTAEKLGLDYEDLKSVNPGIIYCSITGYGKTGPYSGKGGFDLVAQAMSGLMSVTGTPGGPPVKVGVPVCDLNAGMYAAYGILCAYINRLRTGEGQMVDTSLLEGGMAYTFWESVVYFSTGEVPGPLGSAHRLNAPYQAFRTKDGHMVLGAPTQPVWERFCRAIGREDLLAEPRFANAGQRKRHEKELADILAETFAEKGLDYWLELLDKAGTPAGPIYDLAQVYSDPQVLARDMLVELEDPHLGTLKNIGIPVKLSRTGGRIRHRAPALGEHTEETLLWAGFAREEVARLREANLVA